MRPRELPPNERMVALEQLAPARVAQTRHVRRRVDDVREQECGELPIWFPARVRFPSGVKESFYLVEHWRHVGRRGYVTVDGKLDELRAGNPVCEVPAALDLGPAVSGVVQDERRHPD